MNNTGHLHSHFFANDRTQLCLEGIRSLLMSSTGGDEKASEEYGPFYLNILVLYGNKTAASPAA